MAISENLHSRLVVWAKVTLPLMALALLSTLFLVSRRIDPTDAIPYADVDIEERAREPRLTEASYAGVTADGSALTLSAAEARPENESGVSFAKVIVGTLETPDKTRVDMQAATSVMDDQNRTMTLGGGVSVTTTTGYSIQTESLVADLDQTNLSSRGSVTATGPMGKIEAGEMVLTQDPNQADAYQLVFKNRVKLLYTPSN